MPTRTTEESTVRPRRLVSPARWSSRRSAVSAAVLVVVLAAAGVFAWRESIAPLRLAAGDGECASEPHGDVLFGLTGGPYLRGPARIQILGIESLSWSGAASPTYWVVPVTDGGGTGAGDTGDPPPHWNQRVPAVGATMSSAAPADLLVEVHALRGHALLTNVRVTYRTADGFIHVATSDVRLEVDTTGRCATSMGQG